MRAMFRRTFALAAALAACGSSTQQTQSTTPSASSSASAPPASSAIEAAVSAPDRSADDRALDAGRHPAEMLAFFGIAPGMKVAELGAGRGYTTELLARVVGDSGRVFAVNNKTLLGFVGDDYAKRLAQPALKNVVRVDREYDDAFDASVTGLDAVICVLVYHDFVWMKVDRDKMNRAVLAALKPGGVYGIVDHSAKAGAGETEVQTTHRIEQSALVDEITRAGFKLAGEAQFLRNPRDTRDWNDSPRAAGDKRGTSDRFVLKFVKP